jgi:2-polyprenyl-3-methyl-5-hydroxy-6-metoxy-1,4-benzoquinol methylase
MQIETTDGTVRVETTESGRNRVSINVRDSGTYVSKRTWETSYPLALIEEIARTKGAAWTCDEIMRDESPSYLQRHVEFAILSYAPVAWFEGKRVLDFGCGCAASTVVMARMLPGATFVGVELLPEYTQVARKRAAHYGYTNTRFETSPDPNSLPADIGTFDAIVLGAVWEHLLPEERTQLLDRLWGVLNPGGILFLYETPHRYWPVEAHTTGIPLLNYLPAQAALPLARLFSGKVGDDATWPELLRRGIRGGTAHEVMEMLAERERERERERKQPCYRLSRLASAIALTCGTRCRPASGARSSNAACGWQ